MDGLKDINKRKRGASWFGLKDVFYLTLMALGVVATVNVTKLKRGLKEIFSPKPVVVAADQKDIFRQAEARIRAEMEEKYEHDIAALRKSLEEAEKEERETPAEIAIPEPELGTVTDVRKLRSGIPFKTEVKLEKGGIASKERVDAASYTASYQLSLRVPTPAKTL